MSVKDMLERTSSKRISTLSNPSVLSRVTDWVSTGCQPLDMIMGGGIPVGRMTEIYGDTSTGKSLLCAHILAETQAMGGTAVLFDSETATDEDIMIICGVDPDKLIYSVPETIEEVYEDLTEIVEAKQKIDPDGLMTIVWDSVAATSAKKEIDDIAKKGMGAATMGIHARMLSQMCRVLKSYMSKNRVAMVFVNQTRQKIGVMFGPDVVTFGGRAIGFYSSVRLEMKHISREKDKSTGDIIGINVRVGVVKNKVHRPFGQCEFPIIFDYGVDEIEAIMWWLKKRNLVTGSGWKVLGLGDNEIRFQHHKWPDIFEENEDLIRELLVDDYNSA